LPGSPTPAHTLDPATPGVPSTPPSSASPTPGPTATPAVYTFQDEFNGRFLARHWGRHWPGFGDTLWSHRQSRVANGVLTITAIRSGSHWLSDLVDTVGTFEQRYGVFSARMRFTPGTGLWPAFWLAQPQNAAHEIAEIDVMEMCANDPGERDGNDVGLLHAYVHRADGKHAFAIGVRVPNLADQWHVYTVDWRADRMIFLIDGVEWTRFESATEISKVKMAVVLDLAVGGSFCGAADQSTPNGSTLEVDWVRVTR
jgi:beta-glucanase (GH16 family)